MTPRGSATPRAREEGSSAPSRGRARRFGRWSSRRATRGRIARRDRPRRRARGSSRRRAPPRASRRPVRWPTEVMTMSAPPFSMSSIRPANASARPWSNPAAPTLPPLDGTVVFHPVLTCARCGQENPDGAKFCNACGAALEGGARSGEERRLVSVLFVDLVGFTSRSEKLDPEDVRAFLIPYYERVRQRAREPRRQGGEVRRRRSDGRVRRPRHLR